MPPHMAPAGPDLDGAGAVACPELGAGAPGLDASVDAGPPFCPGDTAEAESVPDGDVAEPTGAALVGGGGDVVQAIASVDTRARMRRRGMGQSPLAEPRRVGNAVHCRVSRAGGRVTCLRGPWAAISAKLALWHTRHSAFGTLVSGTLVPRARPYSLGGHAHFEIASGRPASRHLVFEQCGAGEDAHRGTVR